MKTIKEHEKLAFRFFVVFFKTLCAFALWTICAFIFMSKIQQNFNLTQNKPLDKNNNINTTASSEPYGILQHFFPHLKFTCAPEQADVTSVSNNKKLQPIWTGTCSSWDHKRGFILSLNSKVEKKKFKGIKLGSEIFYLNYEFDQAMPAMGNYQSHGFATYLIGGISRWSAKSLEQSQQKLELFGIGFGMGLLYDQNVVIEIKPLPSPEPIPQVAAI